MMLLATKAGISATFLRLALGAVMLPHGAQKALGLFGGQGLTETVEAMTEKQGLPTAVVLLVIAAEFLGSIGLLVGFLTRLCALGIGAVMVGAIVKVHASYGFFMNWSGRQAGEGYEYHLLAIGISLALLVAGGGRWSIDGALAGRRSER